jgi:phosphoglycolate phosphatase
MIECLVLDLDGPILEGRERHYAVYSSILRDHGFEPLPPDEYWDLKRDRHDRREQLARSGAESIYDRFLAEWLERIEHPASLRLDGVQPGAAARLAEWKEDGRRILLATLRQHPENVRTQLNELGLAGYFEGIAVADYRLGSAGKVELLRRVAGALDPATTLWIGDTEVDVSAARSLGCPVCAVSSGLRTAEFLKSLAPDFLHDRLADVELAAIEEALQLRSTAGGESPASA